MGKKISSIELSMLLISQHEYMFELYDIFGDELLMKFISIFSGQIIRVPSIEEVRETIEHLNIWLKYSEYKSKKMLSNLSNDTGYTKVELRSIYSEIDKKMKKLGVGIDGEV